MAKSASRTRRSTGPSGADLEDRVFKALANRDRRQILDALREAPRTTGQLCEMLPHLDRCTVMQHLGKLEKAELILVQRQGRRRWNYLNVVPMQRIYRRWIQEYAQPAAAWATDLKDRLESPPDRRPGKS